MYVCLQVMFCSNVYLYLFEFKLPSVMQLIVEEELVGEDHGSHGEHRDVGVSARHFVHFLETSDWGLSAESALQYSVRV